MTLPEDSLYKPIEATVAKMARGEDGQSREATETYALHVVDDIITGRTGKIWHGSNAGTMRIVTRLAPASVIVGYFFPIFLSCLGEKDGRVSSFFFDSIKRFRRAWTWNFWVTRGEVRFAIGMCPLFS